MSFLLLTAAALVSGVVGEELRIKSIDEFIKFMDNVNNGTSFSGTTVFLDSDIDFTGKTFELIGNSESNFFRGTFDGQGHVISNLKMDSSSSQYVGLFGYSDGLTIKNVILDSSCSIVSSYIASSNAYTGGIIGYCRGYNGLCTIENSANMASVSFSGAISGNLNLGGLAGYLYSYIYVSTVKNCANYGDVTHSGTSSSSYIGGIVGYFYGYSSNRVYIYNSLNHGTITHKGTTSSSLYVGGIAGSTEYTTIENCVSEGKISTPTTAPKYDNYIGSIVGYVGRDISIYYCYYTSELSQYSKYGYKNFNPTESNTLSYDSTSFELNGTVSVGNYTGSSLICALNAAADYYTLREYSRWLLNKDNKAVSFAINGRTPFALNSQIILLPSLVSEGKLWFDGWYKDSEHTSPLTEYEITNDIELYGKWEENTNNYTISFETRREGVSVASITASFGSVVTLPNDLIDGKYRIVFWETSYGDKIESNLSMPARDVILYAAWGYVHIETPDDFIGFSKIVNNGAHYYDMTVFLDFDIDLTGKTFEPIGNTSIYFSGVFDGQGHVISNLNITSSSQYVGLFGYSRGLTIKNVILDSSCAITSSFRGFGYAYIGGIIGQCYPNYGPCIIENSVSMGSVSFKGDIGNSYLYLGGIVGSLSSPKHDFTVKNCANYGDVTHSGESMDSSVGGIIGDSGSSSSKKCTSTTPSTTAQSRTVAQHQGTCTLEGLLERPLITQPSRTV